MLKQGASMLTGFFLDFSALLGPTGCLFIYFYRVLLGDNSQKVKHCIAICSLCSILDDQL